MELQKMKMAYGLINDIKGYHVQVRSSSKSPNKKICDGCTISPVIAAANVWLMSRPPRAGAWVLKFIVFM
jgi:hypothetical protein